MADVAPQDLTENRQGELRTTTIAIVTLATFFIALRFYARYIKGVAFGFDDYMVVLALFFLFVLLSIILIMIYFGLGLHAMALTYDQIESVLKGLLAFECLYVTTVATIKISLLLMYCRAFDVRSLRICSIILGCITIAWAIAIVMVCVFQCTPIAKAWNPMLDGYCIDLKGSFIGNAVPNIVTDVAILTLPVHQVLKLNTDLNVRLQLLVVFGLGGFVIVTSIYRFTTLFQFVPADTTWTLATACEWCVVECAAGIISVCLPTLSPLIQRMMCMPVHRRVIQGSTSAQTGSSGRTGDSKHPGLSSNSSNMSRFKHLGSEHESEDHEMMVPARTFSTAPAQRDIGDGLHGIMHQQDPQSPCRCGKNGAWKSSKVDGGWRNDASIV